MKRLFVLVMVATLAIPGCGSRRQSVRTEPPALEPAANDQKKPKRVINGESETVTNWSTGGP